MRLRRPKEGCLKAASQQSSEQACPKLHGDHGSWQMMQPGHKLILGLSAAVKTLPPWSWKALLDGRCTLGCAAYLTASSSSDQGKGQAEHHQHQHQQQSQRGKARRGKAPLDQTEREAFPTRDKTDFVKAVPGSPSWIWPWDIGSRA
ncbi:hypothetical protein Landi51_11084 [Colletotrichum acutatum]